MIVNPLAARPYGYPAIHQINSTSILEKGSLPYGNGYAAVADQLTISSTMNRPPLPPGVSPQCFISTIIQELLGQATPLKQPPSSCASKTLAHNQGAHTHT